MDFVKKTKQMLEMHSWLMPKFGRVDQNHQPNPDTSVRCADANAPVIQINFREKNGVH